MSKAHTSTKKGKAKKERIRPDAEAALTSIPGITSEDVHTWFYSARILTPEDGPYADIHTYVNVGLGHGYNVKILEIIHIHRNNDKGFMYDGELKEKFRMMLWHGTKTAAVGPILKTGFLPPTAKRQMFGTGIYFADRFSKSANYSDSTTPGSIGYIFLCEVALGQWYTPKGPHVEYVEAPSITLKTGEVVKCDSVMCAGKNVPDRDQQKTLWNGSILPFGKTIPNPKFPQCIQQHNEYIIYKPELAKIRFVLKIEFTV